MSLLRYIQKLQQLDALIRRKSTGNQKEFCKKACMSRSVLNEYLNEMKVLGFPIDYDRQKETYYYKEEGSLVPRLFEKVLQKTELKEYNGGNHFMDNEYIFLNLPEIFLEKKLQSEYNRLEDWNFV